MSEPEEFGAGLPLLEKLKLLAEWGPLLGRVQEVLSADDPHERAIAGVKLLQWAAGKSGTDIDDEALKHLEAVLRTKEAQEAVAWFASRVLG